MSIESSNAIASTYKSVLLLVIKLEANFAVLIRVATLVHNLI
ncbi:hypothetical protein [Crinalium epipsammum]|nr:hypothetical protein [Crinalium epipsammum]